MPRATSAVLSLACVAALTGCTFVVEGLPSALEPPVDDAPAGEVTVVGATDSAIDRLARNALADLETYWAETFPEVYGEQFPPLQGGYFSVDPADVDPRDYPQGVGCGAQPLEVEGNAFYCLAERAPNSDSISYDRAFLEELAGEYGRFIPALVMAHEFGHAVQGRVGTPPSSIATETQADCLAGAWSAWVAGGNAEHSQLREPELDEVLRGYLLLRDPVGTGLNEESAHGSYFDRASAFQEGFDEGPLACRDDFGPDRVFTQGRFSDADLATGGNAPYDQLVEIVESSLPFVWNQAFEDVFGQRFEEPAIEGFRREAPSCARDRGRDLVHCADENLVAFDETDLAAPAYDIGDFAVATAVSIPYGLAVRDQLGLPADGEDAVLSAVCLSGWYAAKVYNRQAGEDVVISPGDLDESVQFLLAYGGEPTVLPEVDASGFQLVDLFRNGFVRGLEACDVRL
jgi:predicted metalloprotease